MAIISFYLEDEDEKLIKNYAKSKNMSISSFLRTATIEKIEDEVDNRLYEEAIREFKENPADVSLEAMRKELNSYC